MDYTILKWVDVKKPTLFRLNRILQHFLWEFRLSDPYLASSYANESFHQLFRIRNPLDGFPRIPNLPLCFTRAVRKSGIDPPVQFKSHLLVPLLALKNPTACVRPLWQALPNSLGIVLILAGCILTHITFYLLLICSHGLASPSGSPLAIFSSANLALLITLPIAMYLRVPIDPSSYVQSASTSRSDLQGSNASWLMNNVAKA